MEKLVKDAMQQAAALKKSPDSVPWKADEPWAQSYYRWGVENNTWEPCEGPASDLTAGRAAPSRIAALSLFTWNIDFMLPSAETRMDAALAHLERLTEQPLSSATTAVVINIQECVPSDLITIGQKQWIRDRFYVTDIDHSAWGSAAYGTTTLVDRRLDVTSCFRLHYSKTQMERDALFVEVAIPTASGSGSRRIRLCNTHLESLVPVPPLRPAQVRLAAEHMHAEGVAGAVVAGDFNAVQPEDDSLHTENGLKDAYLELGGKAGSEEGFTWGQQALPALRERFGCSRMDKVFFYGDGIRLLSLERFGAGVVIGEDHQEERDGLLSLGFEEPWVTDHLGLNAVFSFTSDHHL